MSEKDKISNFNWYKYCFVPECKNTTITAPEKVFVCVPKNPLKRKSWCDAAGCPDKKLKKISHCCEDHFDLKEDLENYLEWKMMGCRKIFRDNVVPHLQVKAAKDPLAITPQELLNLCSKDVHVMDYAGNPLPSTSVSNAEEVTCTSFPSTSSSVTFGNEISDNAENLHSSMSLIWPEEVYMPATTSSTSYQCIGSEREVEHVHVQAKPETLVKSTQTDKEKQIKVLTKNVGVTCNIIPNIVTAVKKLSTSELKINDTVDSISSMTLDSDSPYTPSNEEISSSNLESNLQMQALRVSVYEKYTKFIIEDNPSLFIGVNKESMFIIDLLQKASSLNVRNIYLTLKKIKTNLSFLALGYEFSLSETQAGKAFKSSVHVIAKFLKQLILWPTSKDILLNLPMQFRHRYSDVQSIIDCFEIEIEKPSDAVNQALTWSDYKKCNTAKYLVSVTPDGLINFISEGCCGRSSDMAIVENCGYLDKLPPNTSVLADRGFKQLDVVLNKKQCKLIRPPSVKQDIKSTKKEVKLTKQIASIRIHVERVINRIRNFQLLNIHTRVDNNLLDCLDSSVIIVAALVNMQSEIIKQC